MLTPHTHSACSLARVPPQGDIAHTLHHAHLLTLHSYARERSALRHSGEREVGGQTSSSSSSGLSASEWVCVGLWVIARALSWRAIRFRSPGRSPASPPLMAVAG